MTPLIIAGQNCIIDPKCQMKDALIRQFFYQCQDFEWHRLALTEGVLSIRCSMNKSTTDYS